MRLNKTASLTLPAFFMLALVLSGTSLALAAAKDRIARAIDNTKVSAVQNNVHPLAQARFDRGRVGDSLRLSRVTMVFKPMASQQASLNTLLGQLQNPPSPEYHQWLTPDQFAAQFGLSPNDLNKVVSWLKGEGFTVDGVARSRMWVAFSGTAGEVQSAFHTEIHSYVVNGEPHYANSSDPSVP
ncbi:MAG: protease pro-enzyme activation domain-containing protein, partial [Terriglobia bacterium]